MNPPIKTHLIRGALTTHLMVQRTSTLTTQKHTCRPTGRSIYCTHDQPHTRTCMPTIDELATEICTLAGHINAANHRFLVLIAEFDRRTGWSDGATQSCAHWLNWKCGIAMGAAREKVRVARALEDLPKVSAGMASGALSYSKVREITRVAN